MLSRKDAGEVGGSGVRVMMLQEGVGSRKREVARGA